MKILRQIVALSLLPLAGAGELLQASESAHQAAQQRQAMMRQYLMDQSYRHSSAHMEQSRDYGSSVGQGAGNQGGDQGHHLGQQQGGVGVGALVESGAYVTGPAVGSSGFQFAPQSNQLSVGGDNYAPVSLSNIAASNGSVHIGDVNQGNMYGSQIGSNQSGEQLGNNSSQQSNQQGQQSAAASASQDAVSQ